MSASALATATKLALDPGMRDPEGFLLTEPFLAVCRSVLPVVGERGADVHGMHVCMHMLKSWACRLFRQIIWARRLCLSALTSTETLRWV